MGDPSSKLRPCAAANPQADVQVNVLVPGEAATEMNRGSSISPFALVSMALVLLSHPPAGPNGRFFHRDGRHLSFGYAGAYGRSLLDGSPMPVAETALCGDTRPKGRGLLAVLRRFAN